MIHFIACFWLGVKITLQRTRQDKLKEFFAYYEPKKLSYCHDVIGLMDELSIEHDPNNWRLFIDSSKTSLKAVLLHIGNKLPSVPIAYSVETTENYENLKTLLDRINYSHYNRNLCGDLKVIALLQGLQLGYTKNSCFLCEWDSRAKSTHYIQKHWTSRSSETTEIGKRNVVAKPLVDRQKVYLPPLHIKLGLIKIFIKALKSNTEAFNFLRRFFPKISEAKIKEG